MSIQIYQMAPAPDGLAGDELVPVSQNKLTRAVPVSAIQQAPMDAADAAGLAAQQAQETADEAGLAAEQANTDLATHKTSGDHDDRYLKLDQVVTAPAVGKTPKAGEAGTISQAWIDGLVNELKYLRSVAENVDWSSPMPLWADGQDGLWYDLPDFSTLFQDANGLTPVTSWDQPVGLGLDKHLGLVRGPVLNPTPGPFVSIGEWKMQGGTLSVVDGKLRGTANEGVARAFYFDLPVTIGTTYEVSIEIDVGTATAPSIASWIGIDTPSLTYFPDTGTRRKLKIIGRATGASMRVRIYLSTGSSVEGAYMDVVSTTVRELPGHHFYQPTTTARSTLKQDEFGKYYLKPDGTDDYYNISGNLDLNTSLIGFAHGALSGSSAQSLLSASSGSGYLRSIGGEFDRYTSTTRFPSKTRQSVLLQPNGSGRYTVFEDSTGASALCGLHSEGGLGGTLFLGSYRGASAMSATPLYGLIARTGVSTEAERRQVLKLLDNYLGEVTR